jgi:hypothetical protein
MVGLGRVELPTRSLEKGKYFFGPFGFNRLGWGCLCPGGVIRACLGQLWAQGWAQDFSGRIKAGGCSSIWIERGFPKP